MPEIPFTRVVSVSSADPKFPAENLLRPNDGGRWRGAAAGEKQLSVVLELGVSSPIHSVHIGNDGAAFVEILQGASGGGEFQVLLPTSALMSPAESRAGLETRRVRVFGPKNLVQNSTQSSWDRLRVVLSQPYCQSRPFGLSFIRVFSAPEEEKVTPEAPIRRLGFFTLREEQEVGEGQNPPGSLLFHRPSPQPDSTQDSAGPSYALAALGVKPPKRRLASQNSDGNLPKKQPKLPWAPNSQNSTQNSGNSASNLGIFAQNSWNSSKNSSPNSGNPSKNSSPNPSKNSTKNSGNSNPNSGNSNPNSSPNFGNSSKNSNPNFPKNSPKKPQNSPKKPQNSSKKPQNSPKKPQNSSQTSRNSQNFPQNSQNSVLSGVTLALSGFQNPLRSQLRAAALELGAKYCPDWTQNCTHLVCAFPRTPKASQARQDGGILIGPQWIWDCQSKGRRLACGPYLLDGSTHSDSEGEEPEEATPPASPTPNMGKGEELEELATPIPATPPESGDSDSQSDSDPYAGSTEENSEEEEEGEGLPLPPLPDFFQNKTFFFHGDFPAGEERKLRRFAVAFGGSLAPYMDDSVTHVVTNQLWSSSFQEALKLRPSLVFVRPDWLLESGERQRPLPVKPFAVQPAE